MNCKELKYWLRTRDMFSCETDPDADGHLESCPSCRRLFRLDTCLEETIQSGFIQKEIPEPLIIRIDERLFS